MSRTLDGPEQRAQLPYWLLVGSAAHVCAAVTSEYNAFRTIGLRWVSLVAGSGRFQLFHGG